MKTFKTFRCENCKCEFHRELRQLHKNKQPAKFCSQHCCHQYKNIQQDVICNFCSQPFKKINAECKRHPIHYCSSSCAASANNKKRRRSRRSKSEAMLYNLLVEAFPTLDLIANDKSMLNGLEVDIAIPSLKLAIEWNGIVHFKPIYGQDKLNRIQSIDQRKQELANQLQINLIVIPDLVSKVEYVKECYIKISSIINDLLAPQEGIEPS